MSSNSVQPKLSDADAFAQSFVNVNAPVENKGLAKVKEAFKPLIDQEANIAAQAEDFANADANRLALGTRIQNGLTTIGNKAYDFVSMPIAPMANAKTVEFVRNPKDNGITNLYKKVGNTTFNLSKTIANKGEGFSRKAGEQTFTAIDGAFGKLSAAVSNVNKGTGNFVLAIGKTIAIAISYAVRTIFLAISQLFQVAPAAMLVGTGVLTAVAVAEGVREFVTAPGLAILTLAGMKKSSEQEEKINDLQRQIDILTGKIKITKETVVEETTTTPAPVAPEAPVTTSKAKTALKVTVAAVLTAAVAAAALKYGVPAVVTDTVTNVGQAAYSKIASIFANTASNVCTLADKDICTLADGVIANTGVCAANSTAGTLALVG